MSFRLKLHVFEIGLLVTACLGLQMHMLSRSHTDRSIACFSFHLLRV